MEIFFTINRKLLSITLSGSGRLSRIDSLDVKYSVLGENSQYSALDSLTILCASFHTFTWCENNNEIGLIVLISTLGFNLFFFYTYICIYFIS